MNDYSFRRFRYFVLLTMTTLSIPKSMAASEERAEVGIQISITIDEKKGVYTITLKNSATNPINYIDGLVRYAGLNGVVPAHTALLLRSSPGARFDVPESLASSGYTALIRESRFETIPLAESVLKPNEQIKSAFSISKLADGIYQTGGIDKSGMEKCQISVRIRVYLDGYLKTWVDGSSDWKPGSLLLEK